MSNVSDLFNSCVDRNFEPSGVCSAIDNVCVMCCVQQDEKQVQMVVLEGNVNLNEIWIQ